eukprot:c14910_g1_i1.p1 GENE.c14910_g1_i1~~c14910_g1_i1.p1  ORF type:complete len:257 (-),score=69.87 c14910_g1_i1:37-807(-)
MRLLLVVCLAFLCFDCTFSAVTLSSSVASTREREVLDLLTSVAAQSEWQVVDALRANLNTANGRKTAQLMAHVLWLVGAMLRTLMSEYTLVNIVSGLLVLVAVYTLLRVAIAEYKDAQSGKGFQNASSLSLKMILRIMAFATLTLQPTTALLTGASSINFANILGYFLLFVSYAFSFLDISDISQASTKLTISGHLLFAGAVLLVVSSYLDHTKFQTSGKTSGNTSSPSRLNRGAVTILGHAFLIAGAAVQFTDRV